MSTGYKITEPEDIYYLTRLTDHLGNVRVTFRKNDQNQAEIVQEDHYYPFGLQMSGMHYDIGALMNKFLYNGKELQDQTGYYDYGFRQMDPQLGRWHVIDLLAEQYYHESTYCFAGNNPTSNVDPNGRLKVDPTTGILHGIKNLKGDGGFIFIKDGKPIGKIDFPYYE